MPTHPQPPESKLGNGALCPGPAEDPTACLSSMTTRGICGEPEATDLLTTEGLPAGLAGSQPHTYLSQSLPPKKSHREK